MLPVSHLKVESYFPIPSGNSLARTGLWNSIMAHPRWKWLGPCGVRHNPVSLHSPSWIAFTWMSELMVTAKRKSYRTSSKTCKSSQDNSKHSKNKCKCMRANVVSWHAADPLLVYIDRRHQISMLITSPGTCTKTMNFLGSMTKATFKLKLGNIQLEVLPLHNIIQFLSAVSVAACLKDISLARYFLLTWLC